MATYTVKRGDTLSKIGQQFGIPWQQIFQANKGNISNPNLIYVGQQFTIPGKGGTSVKKGPTTAEEILAEAKKRLEPYIKTQLALAGGDVELGKKRLAQDREVFGNDIQSAFQNAQRQLTQSESSRNALVDVGGGKLGVRERPLGQLTEERTRQTKAFNLEANRKEEDLTRAYEKFRKELLAKKPIDLLNLQTQIRSDQAFMNQLKQKKQVG